MVTFASILIKTTLIASVALTTAAGIMMLAAGNALGGSLWLLFGLIGVCYAYFVWGRIPFATSTLVASCRCVRDNVGVCGLAVVSAGVGAGWVVLWSGVYVGIAGGGDNGDGNDDYAMNGAATFGLLVALYWVMQVISNVVHTTVAGTVGTWWFNPPMARGCCSAGVKTSFRLVFFSIFFSLLPFLFSNNKQKKKRQ